MLLLVSHRLALNMVRKESFELVKCDVTFRFLLFLLALLIFLDFKFISHVFCTSILPLEVSITDLIVGTVFLDTFVEGVDQVADDFFLFYFCEMPLNFFAEGGSFLLLTPLFLDFLLVVSVTAFLVLSQSRQRFTVQVSLTDMLNEVRRISDQFALYGIDDWAFMLVGEPITTNDLHAR